MATEQQPLADELTPKAKEEGVAEMQAYLTRRSGRPRSREDARAAFENLLGLYATVCEWQARAARGDLALEGGATAAAAPAPRSYRRKKSTTGRKAESTESRR